MKSHRMGVLGIVIVLLASLGGATFAQEPEPGDFVPDRFIVGVRPGVPPAAVFARHGVKPDQVYGHALNGFAGFVTPGQVTGLVRDENVLSIVRDRVVKAIGKPEEEGRPGEGGTTQPQVMPAGVQRIGAVDLGVTGTGVGVAVVDTGLDFNHRDLTVAPAQYPASGAQDDDGHGTHVGGIIAAKNNTIDVVGVAPAATLYAVKVLDSKGRGTDSGVIAGLDWVYHNANLVSPPIRVANMSLGRRGTVDDSPLLRKAVQSLAAINIAVVVAAGNDPELEVSEQVPATYPEVMAIASTTSVNGSNQSKFVPSPIAADAASYFTSDGAYVDTPDGKIGVTISAPGEERENIGKSGVIQSVGILSTRLGEGTTRMSGTSMASPHVAGVVALMWEAWQETNPGQPLPPDTARSLIRSSADRTGEAPLNCPVSTYTFDGEREGILYAPEAVLGALGK